MPKSDIHPETDPMVRSRSTDDVYPKIVIPAGLILGAVTLAEMDQQADQEPGTAIVSATFADNELSIPRDNADLLSMLVLSGALVISGVMRAVRTRK